MCGDAVMAAVTVEGGMGVDADPVIVLGAMGEAAEAADLALAA